MPEYLDPDNIIKQPESFNDQSLMVNDPHALVNQSLSGDAIMVPPDNIEDDIITLSIRDDELPDAVLKTIMQGLAEEAWALKTLRIKKQNENKGDISQISMKRGTLLKYMSEAVIQRQALVGGTGEIDLKSPKFHEVIKMFFTYVADTFDDVKIPPEFRDLFFQSLSRKMEGWELKAEKILKNIR